MTWPSIVYTGNATEEYYVTISLSEKGFNLDCHTVVLIQYFANIQSDQQNFGVNCCSKYFPMLTCLVHNGIHHFVNH